MRKNYVIKGLALLIIAFLFAACKKNSASSPVSGTQLAFAVSADNASSAVGASATGLGTNALGAPAIIWTSGTANISRFKLEAKKNNSEIEISSKNLANIDLFAITPAFISAAIDTGTYSEIELKVLLVKSSSGAIPLTLKGSYTSSTGTVIPIELDFNDDAFIKAEAENIHVDGKTDLATTIKFHLNKLVAGIAAPVLDAATQTGGAIVISNSVNVDIYNKIKANFTLSGEFKGFEHHDKSERKHDN